ncbi:Fatty-acid peroxygenase [Planctomycetales bacterium 10988]|nr:Fatty-acid peroxygenase [Planctomycetales bacterium 10988]
MRNIPQERIPDSTLALLRDPYRFITKRCERHQSDLFQTRVMLRKVICLQGKETAELFYDRSKFHRKGAAPARIQKTLFGRKGIQGLNGEDHQHRKKMFLDLMSTDRLNELTRLSKENWLQAAVDWQEQKQVIFYDAIQEVLTRAVCQWAGVPLPESMVVKRTRQLVRLFDKAGNAGPKYYLARIARIQTNAWMKGLISQIRTRRYSPPPGSAAEVIALHRDLAGNLLPEEVAAVELLNVLRPVVAVSVYLTFVAMALENFPGCREELNESWTETYPEWFAQEVRRFYPFFPFVAAVVRNDFVWKEYAFPQGHWVFLDLYGTNHDQRIWDRPEEFKPSRFQDWQQDPFTLIPQGGGEHAVNHRCPGEWITLELMKLAVEVLRTRLTYHVPHESFQLNFRRVPALPPNRFEIQAVKVLS